MEFENLGETLGLGLKLKSVIGCRLLGLKNHTEHIDLNMRLYNGNKEEPVVRWRALHIVNHTQRGRCVMVTWRSMDMGAV